MDMRRRHRCSLLRVRLMLLNEVGAAVLPAASGAQARPRHRRRHQRINCFELRARGADGGPSGSSRAIEVPSIFAVHDYLKHVFALEVSRRVMTERCLSKASPTGTKEPRSKLR
jgi:hypothetical protein